MDTYILYYLISSYLINLAVLPLHCLVMFCMDKEYDLHTCPDLLLALWLFSPLCLILEILIPVIKVVFTILDNIFKTMSGLLINFLGESKYKINYKPITKEEYYNIMFGNNKVNNVNDDVYVKHGNKWISYDEYRNGAK